MPTSPTQHKHAATIRMALVSTLFDSIRVCSEVIQATCHNQLLPELRFVLLLPTRNTTMVRDTEQLDEADSPMHRILQCTPLHLRKQSLVHHPTQTCCRGLYLKNRPVCSPSPLFLRPCTFPLTSLKRSYLTHCQCQQKILHNNTNNSTFTPMTQPVTTSGHKRIMPTPVNHTILQKRMTTLKRRFFTSKPDKSPMTTITT